MSLRLIRRGFTLVELSLAIAFISVLSIIIVVVINGSVSSYRKGLTLNLINTIGMDLADDIRTTIINSPAKKINVDEMCGKFSGSALDKCKSDGASKFVSVVKRAKVKEKSSGSEQTNVPVFGAFCTGEFSYIWNSGYYSSDKNEVGTSKATFKGNSEFKLLKVEDSKREVCGSVLKNANDYEAVYNDFSVADTNVNKIELLSGKDESGLALYDLNSGAPATSKVGNDLLYSVSFILGTIQGGINVMSNGNNCTTPGGYIDSNFDYSAINKFSFSIHVEGPLT